jgi:hypothetical protein
MIDLTTFEQPYRDVELEGYDEPVRVYQVPKPLVWRVKPDRDKPHLPLIEMKLATGRTQKRAARAGDAEHETYLHDLGAWQEEQDDLQSAAGLVWALKDVKYPDDLGQPPGHVSGLDYPEHELLRKEFWLKATVLARPVNFSRVLSAITEMDGLDREVADIKAGFRPGVSGDSAGGLAAERPEGDDTDTGQ